MKVFRDSTEEKQNIPEIFEGRMKYRNRNEPEERIPKRNRHLFITRALVLRKLSMHIMKQNQKGAVS